MTTEPPRNKLERFTQRARRVLSYAEEEASTLKHSSISPEHILLGLIREEGGVASRALAELDVKLDDARRAVRRLGIVKE